MPNDVRFSLNVTSKTWHYSEGNYLRLAKHLLPMAPANADQNIHRKKNLQIEYGSFNYSNYSLI